MSHPAPTSPRPADAPVVSWTGRPLRRLGGVALALTTVATGVVVGTVPGEGEPLAAPAAAACAVNGDQVTSGHFDVGPTLGGGALVPRVKDDRSSPARWRAPAEVVFVLGEAAAASLPPGLGFIGPAGTRVHMIGGVQQAGVPWLGWNTQDQALLRAATGPVTMSLTGVSGPGDLAVFTSGTFGTAVGQRIVDTVGGPRSTTVPLNTHAHGNWVFTAPGVYRVSLGFSVPTAQGVRSGATTLTFAVGGCGTAPAAARSAAEQPSRSVPTAPAAAPSAGGVSQEARTAPDPANAAAAAAAGRHTPPASAVGPEAPGEAPAGTPGADADGAARSGPEPDDHPGTEPITAPSVGGAAAAGPVSASGAGTAPSSGGSGGLTALDPVQGPASAFAGTVPHWPSLLLGAGGVAVLLGFGTLVYRIARAR